jgi:sporulation protein YlmC with PRC-barrel domain
MASASSPRAEILRSRDFIGWAVTSSNGANVGTVSDILIDRQGTVRYLAVDPGFFKKPVLLPVEALDWGDGTIQTAWTDTEVRRLPPYDASIPLTAEVMEELGRAFPRHYGAHVGQPLVSGEGPSVVPLKEAKNFRLAKGAPNLKGWAVYGADNEKVGEVTQMLVDPVELKIRYLDVDVADDLFGLKDDRHVLVPLEAVELRERSQDVWVQGVSGAGIAALPGYLGGPVDPLLAQETDRVFAGSGSAALPAPADSPLQLEAGESEDEDETEALDEAELRSAPPADAIEPADVTENLDTPTPIRDAEFARDPGDGPPPLP